MEIKKSAPAFLCVVWILWITERYFHYHPEYFEALAKERFFRLLLLPALGLYLAWAAHYRFLRARREARIKTSPLMFIAVLFGLTLIIGGLHLFDSGLHRESSFLRAEWSLITIMIPLFATPLLLFTVAAGAGRKLLGLLRIEDSGPGIPLLCAGLGLSIMSMLLCALAFMGLFTRPVLVGTLVVLMLLFWSEEKEFVKNHLFRKFELRFSPFSFEPFLVMLLFIGAALNLFDLIRPMPTGWDDLGRYMNLPKVLADTGNLPDGNVGWPWAIVMALGFGLQRSVPLALYLSYSGVILSCMALFVFARSHLHAPRIGLLAAAIFSLMPMTMHQSFADLKLDMGLFFFLILATYTLIQWHEHGGGDRWLILTGILLGTALAIKITAVFAVFALVAVLARKQAGWAGFFTVLFAEVWACLCFHGSMIPGLTAALRVQAEWVSAGLSMLWCTIWLVKREAASPARLIKPLCMLLAGSIIMLLPWMARGYHETNSFSPFLMLSGKRESIAVNLARVGIKRAECSFTAVAEEQIRYIGYEKDIRRFFLLPWRMTMNTTVHGYYLDLSFLYLALLPAAGLLALVHRRRNRWKEPWPSLVLLGAVSWGFWLFVAKGVPWYNIYGFLPLALLTGGACILLPEPVWLKRLFALLIIVSLPSMLLLRTGRFGNEATSRFAFGIWNAERTIDDLVPGYRNVADLIARNPPASAQPGKVYRIGTYIRYFIPDNLRRVFDDPVLDIFTCLDGGRIEQGRLARREPLDDQRTNKRLKKLGFRYVIFDPSIASIERNENGTLHQKARRFVKFANDNLEIIHHDPSQRFVFMEIP